MRRAALTPALNPKLRHASQLAEVFDAIAATVTIPQ